VTHIDQVFINSTNRNLEATYIFPLPKGATVDDFYLYINGKRIKGEILESNRARNIYEGIVRRMEDPGLVEYIGHDLFKCRVYPVPRKGEQRFEMKFSQVMPFEAGLTKYVYPMRTDKQSARTLQDFTMSVKIESKVPIKNIYSPSHNIYSRKKDDHHAVAGFEKNAALLDRDFELFFTVSEKEVGLNLLTFREPGEPGFFMIMASPKSKFRNTEIIGKRITFVIDTSGSMSGAKMKHAKKALKYCLEHLNGDDLFNVVRFSTDVEAFRKTPVSASKDNIQQAVNFVSRMEAAGGTAIDESLQMALAGHKNSKEPNLVVFITDGHPTVGETDPGRIVKNVTKANRVAAKVFVFGVGNEINTHLLDRISGENNADSTYVKPNAEIAKLLGGFYDKISHPVLSDLKLDFGKIHEYDVLPKRMPDLFKGSQLIVFGRYRNEGHTALTLTGHAGDKTKKFTFEGKFAKRNKDNDFIPRLWATRKIGYLLDNIRLQGQQKELVDEVIRLAKRYGIVTPYTSYLVTEDTPKVAVRGQRPIVQTKRPPRRRRPRFSRPMSVGKSRGTGSSAGLKGYGRGGGGSMDGLAQTESVAPAPASAPMMDMAGADMSTRSGERAVTMAKEVKKMKTASATRADDDEAAGLRYVAGRAFSYRGDGVWVDMRFKSGMKVLKVKYMGKAWFKLVQKSGLLKKVFGLGQKVLVVVGKNKAIEITADGEDSISSGKLKSYLP
ncbi:MAG: VWA domain-containing protein, partial [Deltaproteobacteria bacterium]|nr:VWA domain-containing protein [Deltaproteobacteria bacterium]